MPHFTYIPARGTVPDASLYTRLSTPGFPDAKIIDRACPTILFLHPVWADSYFFYPQFEDSSLSEEYNLLSFDLRGHGMTVSERYAGEWNWASVADDIGAFLAELALTQVHIVACGTSVSAARILTARRTDLVITSAHICPSVCSPSEEETTVIQELQQTLDNVVTTGDPELLEMVMKTVFGFCLGEEHIYPLREIRDEYVFLAKQRLHSGQLKESIGYLRSLLSAADDLPHSTGHELLVPRCPIMVISQEGATGADAEDWTIHHTVPGPTWLSLACPHVINPLITSFRVPSTPRTASSTLSQALSSPRPQSRKPSTPREVLTFNIGPPPLVAPGVMTIGDALDLEEWGKYSMNLERKASVVHMIVEVLVTVDGEDGVVVVEQ